MIVTNCEVTEVICPDNSAFMRTTDITQCKKDAAITASKYTCTDNQYIATPSAYIATQSAQTGSASATVGFSPEVQAGISDIANVVFFMFVLIGFYMGYQIVKGALYRR